MVLCIDRGSRVRRVSRSLFGNSCPYVLVALAGGETGVMGLVRATGLSYATVRRCTDMLLELGLVYRRSTSGSVIRYLYSVTELGMSVAMYFASIICELDDDFNACICADSMLGSLMRYTYSDVGDDYAECSRRFN